MTNRGVEGTVNSNGLRDHPAGFEIRAESTSSAVHLVLTGEFDLGSERIFRERLEELRNNGFKQVVFDLRDLTFIDSTGLRLLIAEWERSRREGYDFVLVKGSEAIQSVLTVTGLEKVLPIVDEAPVLS